MMRSDTVVNAINVAADLENDNVTDFGGAILSLGSMMDAYADRRCEMFWAACRARTELLQALAEKAGIEDVASLTPGLKASHSEGSEP